MAAHKSFRVDLKAYYAHSSVPFKHPPRGAVKIKTLHFRDRIDLHNIVYFYFEDRKLLLPASTVIYKMGQI